MPDSAVLQCPSCRSPLKVGRRVEKVEEDCPVCRAAVTVTMFPRLYGEFAADPPDPPASEGEAACTFFPELRAEKVCDECGSFLSRRAAVLWCGQDLCLPCLHRLREGEKTRDHIGRARLDDRRALALVTWFAPFSLFTAPLALFLLLRHRGRPKTFQPRGRGLWWVAMGLSVAWLVAWTALIVGWVALVKDGFT